MGWKKECLENARPQCSPGCSGRCRPCQWRWSGWPWYRWAPLRAPIPVPVQWTRESRRWRLPAGCAPSLQRPAAEHRCSTEKREGTTLVRRNTFFDKTCHPIRHAGMPRATHLHTYRQVILFDAFVVERMIHFDVRPRVPVVRALLQVEGVELVGLRSGSRHQAVVHRGVAFDARATVKQLLLD